MASIKRIKTSSQFSNNKPGISYKDNSNNSENVTNNEENIKNNYIEKSFLEELLKCELCENIFDLNIHIPVVIKCGHTFCKKCVLNIHNNKNKLINNSCPFDNMQNAFNIETCVINLRVELLIKKIFQKENDKIQKKIVYSKPDVKKVNQNVLNNENSSNKKNREYGYKKYEEINDNFNTKQIEDEINVNNKLLFEDEKIKGALINETIDTIPLYDEKSFENVSFKEDVNELFEKKNIMTNKKPFLPESIRKELNRNKIINNNKNSNRKKENEQKINNNKTIKPLTKLIPNLALTPNKNKNLKVSKEIPLENNYNYTDRNINTNEYIKRQIILENNNSKKNDIKIPELNKISKIPKKIKTNEDIIVLNKKEEEKANKDINTNNYPPKKIIVFSSTNNNRESDNKEYNYNKLNTIQNLENDDKKLKMSLILNKNANILSTQILKNTNTNTIEAKNINYEQMINYSNRRPKKIGRNYNDNEAFTKNRTFNFKNEDNNSLLDLLDNSNKENKNSELNKNIKVLNKSNNNNSSSYSNSNSNSVYNKKKVINENNVNIKKDEIGENNNFYQLKNVNSKSQNLLSIENLKNLDINKDSSRKEKAKLRPTIDQVGNNLTSNSNYILKKQKNTSPVIFSSKHFNKNRKSEINLNEQKENIELNVNENNIRRANSFITNNKVLIKKRKLEEKRNTLENELNMLIKSNKNINIKPSIDIIKEIFEDKKYENDLENIKIKLLEKNDLFMGIMDNNDIYPKRGILYTHNGDYYNGEFSDGKKNGQGNIIYANGTKYEGSFKNDYHDGFGKLIQLNGETYEGDWKKGKINGNGMRIHANGNKYIGNYVNNIRNGNGHLIFVNGESYKGNFLNGKANGNGVFKFKNGNIYEGEFKDNLIMGKGTLTLKNGDKYIGVFTNGSINGKGTFIDNNGEKYVGNFEANKKNGYGKLYDKNGVLIKEGMWENGIYLNKE